MKTYGKSGDKLKEITDKLEQGIEELFNSEQYKEYLKTMSKFTDYSFNNTMLIFMQRPDASHIAGYKSWQTNFNRHVKRGEKGITIIAPCPYKEKTERERTDPVTNQPVLGADGRPATETIETTRISFRAVTVFDISQTEGEPLPSLGVDELTGSVENYAAFFDTLKQTSPFPIEFEAMEGKKGYCNFQERRIAIKESMSETQNIKTAIHEITHAQLHDYYNTAGQDAAPENKKSRNMREVEAESVAYVVCQRYGIDTSEYSFPYVAGWESHDKEILKNSLSVIQETADNLITNIDVTFQKIIQEQKQHEVMQLSEKSDFAEPEKTLQTHTVCIYQLKPECGEVLFIGWDNLQNHGGFQPENYNKIWEGELKQEEQGSFLEEIYIRFNINLPTDFTGHSLSPSDVVSVDGNAYFVDKIGFKPVQMEAPVMEFEAAPVMGFSM